MPNPMESLNNLYILHEKLGEGGMGVVFRATHRLTGRAVALKRLRGTILHERSGMGDGSHSSSDTEQQGQTVTENSLRQFIAEEFQILASLHHPHIVSVLDFGFDEHKDPYFTMELLHSPKTITQWGSESSLQVQAELLVQLLQALAYLHRRGILHRDIKSSNVLVEEGKAKLLDFGIANAVGSATRLAGTLEYMAPELLLGQPPTPATDLYAVGVLAFELFTNRFPRAVASRTLFLQDVLGNSADATLPPDVLDMLSARDFSSETGSALADVEFLETNLAGLEESSGPVSKIITRLLDRSPTSRYQNATDVIHDLSEALGLHLPVETRETRESFLQAATFVGREREMEELSSGLRAARMGHGSVILVSGESGVGKSRLLHELRIQALVRSSRVIQSQSQAIRGGSYQLWASVLRELCLYTEGLSALDIGILKEVVPDLEQLLRQQGERPPPVQAHAAQTRLRATIERVFGLQQIPILILLEDLQWAEAESLELLEQLVNTIQHLPVLVVGNYREDEATEELRQLKASQTIRLKRLDRAQVAALCESMLGEAGKQPALVEYLQRQTEGNVFFLVEVLRALAEGAGQLGSVGEQALPEHLLTGGIERLLERRLQKIPPAELGLLELAAVAGRKIDERILGPASGRPDLTPWLLLCANAFVLEAQGGIWHFAHDKMRELVVAHLNITQQKTLHHQLAETITSVYPGDAFQDPALAYHWDKADVPEKAYRYYIKAAQSAARLNALREARAHYAAALSAIGRLPDSEDKRRKQAEIMLLKMGASQLSETLDGYIAQTFVAESILDSLPQEGPNYQADQAMRSRLCFLRARGYFLNSDPRNAMIWYKASLDLASLSNAIVQRVASSAATGHILLLQGYLQKSQPLLQGALDFFGAHGQQLEAARLLGFLGVAAVGQGQIMAGQRLIQQAQARLSADPSFRETALAFLVTRDVLLQDWKGLQRMAINHLQLNQHHIDDMLSCTLHWMCAWADACLGQHEAAAQHRKLAGEFFAKRPTTMVYDWLLSADAEMALRSGNIELAIEHAQKAIEVATNMDGVFALGLAHRIWAQALAAQARPDWEAADIHLAESIRLLESGQIWLSVAHTRRIWGQMACSRGDKFNAIAQYRMAASLLEESPDTAEVIGQIQQELTPLTTE